jgi:hypothetical protein
MSAMQGMWLSQAGARRWAAGFALLALLVLVLIPPGFMVSRQDDHAAMVICTGHGPASSVADLVGHPGKAPSSRHDAPCVFAGHAIGAAPSLMAMIARPIMPTTQLPLAVHFDLAPGRGLAAPPPPSQGPPQLTL